MLFMWILKHANNLSKTFKATHMSDMTAAGAC